jgi:hypothetical protein
LGSSRPFLGAQGSGLAVAAQGLVLQHEEEEVLGHLLLPDEPLGERVDQA